MKDNQLTIRYKQSIDVINKLNDFLISVKASNYFRIEDLFNYMEPIFKQNGYREKDVDYGKIKKILILHEGGVGDFVMFTPVLREIRAHYPKDEIFLLETSTQLAQFCPYVDKVIKNPYTYIDDFYDMYEAALHLSSLLLPYHIDIVFDYKNFSHTGLVTYMCGAAVRIGFGADFPKKKCIYEKINHDYISYLLTEKISFNTSNNHVIDSHISMLESYFDKDIVNRQMEVWYTPFELERMYNILIEKKFQDSHLYVMSFGGLLGSKHWPIEKYIELCKKIYDVDENAKFILIGGNSEINDSNIFTDSFSDDQVINFVSKISYRETAALMKLCSCYIGNDTSAMHMAVASSLPVLVPFSRAADLKFDGFSTLEQVVPKGVSAIIVIPKHAQKPCCDRDYSQGCYNSRPHCIKNIATDTMLLGWQMLLEKVEKKDDTTSIIY